MASEGLFRAGVAAIALFVCALLVPSIAAAADGSITGTVNEAVGGKAPIKDIEVCAFSQAAKYFDCDFTGASGEYSIPGLIPATDYIVEFWGAKLGYVTQFYDGKASFKEADEVEVVSGTPTTDIDAELVKGGTIEGTATDAGTKAAVKDVEVCAFSEEGKEEFRLGGCALTDVAGAYAIPGLADDEYIVEFFPLKNPDYIPQFYDGAAFLEDADLVTIAAGNTATGIDAELVVGGRIAGTVSSAATGLPLESIEVCAREGAGSNFYVSCAITNGAGQYTLRGLPTDFYKVEFSPEFEGFGADGYPTQYYNGKPTLAQAELVSVFAPNTTFGINASLGTPPTVAPQVVPPTILTPQKPLKCRKGFKKRKVRGKVRCVKIARHKPRGGHKAKRRHGLARPLRAQFLGRS